MTSRRNLISLLTVLGLALIGVVGAGLWPKLNRQKALVAEARTESAKVPVVRAVKVERAEGSAEVELPADLQAKIESPIYARVEGYISKRYVDIGAKVTKGQMLAELETPDLDQQLQQARAAVSQSAASIKQAEARLLETRAALKLAEVTATRWQKLATAGVSSAQDSDEKAAAYEVKKAEAEAAQATVAATQDARQAAQATLKRYEEMKSFTKLVAPFEGFVTYRLPDVGTLIQSGVADRKELFRVSDISLIRVFVNVPQAYVNSIQAGTPAKLIVSDLGRSYDLNVSGIAHALDMTTRTMLAVIKLPNPDNALKPGMFSRVVFQLPKPPSILAIPADAVVTRSEGAMVAAVTPERRVEFRKIHITRDTGDSVELDSGVREGDTLILNPNDEIRNGVPVEVRLEGKKAGTTKK